jgi:GntR family transcriptional regulator
VFEPGKPLYSQISEQIRAQIQSGVLKPGDKLPSTRQLMAHYEVSETVIRFAMVELKTLRLVYGQPGRGVYVANQQAER